MFHHLRGKLTEINPALAIVECQGVGYAVNITLSTYTAISNLKEVFLYVLPIYKEDSQTLFGFASKLERETFELLIGVSGVGGNTARVILSSLNAKETMQAIANDDVNLLKSVKGIGAKTAQRIIVDLKDKIHRMGTVDAGDTGGAISLVNEASSALEVLGYLPRQTDKILRNLASVNPEITLEELIKEALKKL